MIEENTLLPPIYEDAGFFIKNFYGVHVESSVSSFLPVLATISIVLSMLFVLGIVYATYRFREIRIEESKKFSPINIEEIEDKRHVGLWDVILKHMESDNPAEWKIAIIEADNLLDELLRERGYEGETLGDRMKSIDGKKVVSLQAAWDAHKVRNALVHEADYEPPHFVVKEAIGKFKRGFEALGVLLP